MVIAIKVAPKIISIRIQFIVDRAPTIIMMIIMNGPNSVAAWRKRKKFTQAQAAKLMAISQSFFSNIENGKQAPSVQVALRFQKKAGISIRAWALNSGTEK